MSTTSNKILVEDIIKFYNAIKPKNPKNSYTVLAAVTNAFLKCDDNKLIALASGTQANLRVYADDIEDCHAESMVKRAYKRYLIDTLSKVLAESKNKQCLKTFIGENLQQDLTLFISQFPCGFLKRYEGDEPISNSTGTVMKRKPGRGTLKDGHIVYVEKDPCCDKLKRWLKEGLQGKRLKQLFGIEGKISKILISNCESDKNFNYKIAIDKFKQLMLNEDNQTIQIDVVDVDNKQEFVFEPDQQPQPVSVAWWSQTNTNQSRTLQFSEFIVDGRRIGLTKKLLAKDSPRDKLKIANYWLKKDIAELERLFKQLQ